MNTIDKALTSKADITAGKMLDSFFKIHDEYWSALKDMQSTHYITPHEAMEDIRKVSQLGLALVAYQKAFTAMNTVRCN